MRLTATIVYSFHLFLWSGYSIVGWLSNKDSLLAKSVLLVLFFYLSYLIAYTILKARKEAVYISLFSLFFFMIGQQVYHAIFL